MSFSELERVVDAWLREHPNFKLILADENESRLYFEFNAGSSEGGDLQFYVKCPTSANSSWDINSDQDNVPSIIECKRYCKIEKNVSVEKILNMVLSGSSASAKAIDKSGDDEDDGMDDDDDDYDDNCDWVQHDDDALMEPPVKQLTGVEKDIEDEMENRFAKTGTPLATKRLISDMKALQKSEGKFGIYGTPREDNLYIWDVKLVDFDKSTKLGKDLADFSKKHKKEAAISLEMTFKEDYPMTPPFVRVIRPKFKFLTGHVTIGGSICMQMLTRSGWSPGNDIESILIQIRAEITSDPNARLEVDRDDAYTESEAKNAFERMVSKYKWN